MNNKISYVKTLGKVLVFCLLSYSSINFLDVLWQNSIFGLEVVKVYGFFPMWAICTGALIFPLVAIWIVQEDLKINLLKVNPNKLLTIIGLGLAPLIAFGFYNKSVNNIEGYVECKSMRDVALRYSSRTYAVSPELCEQ